MTNLNKSTFIFPIVSMFVQNLASLAVAMVVSMKTFGISFANKFAICYALLLMGCIPTRYLSVSEQGPAANDASQQH